MYDSCAMTLALWRSPLSRALHRNRSLPNARYVQLATVRSDGSPANRTIVFRGFVGEQFCRDVAAKNTLINTLQFVTDRRSEKAIEIEHQSPGETLGEVCWYFPKTREQFRLRGSLTLITEDTADESGTPLQTVRSHLWQALSDNARIQFAWPHPGHPRADADAFQPDIPSDTEPVPHFCVLLLQPHAVDHLELRGEPQNRWHYALNDHLEWDHTAVNP